MAPEILYLLALALTIDPTSSAALSSDPFNLFVLYFKLVSRHFLAVIFLTTYRTMNGIEILFTWLDDQECC